MSTTGAKANARGASGVPAVMTTRYWKLRAQWSGYGIGLGRGPDGECVRHVQRTNGPKPEDVLATLIVRPQRSRAPRVEEELGARADDVGERFR